MDRTARLLVRRGYAGTSLRDIAQACDIKAGSLYYHFEGKDALVEEILMEGLLRVDARVRAALENAAGEAPLSRIRIAMEAHLASLHDSSDYCSAYVRCSAHVPADMRRRLRDVRASYENMWSDLLLSARETGAIGRDIDIETLKHAVLGMINWTLEWRFPAGAGSVEMANRFFRIAFRGAGNG